MTDSSAEHEKSNLSQDEMEMMDLHLKIQNVVERLAQVGIEPTGAGDAKFAYFTKCILDWGIVTRDQMVQFNLGWNRIALKTLQDLEKKVNESIERQQAQHRVQTLLHGVPPGGNFKHGT